MRHVLTVLLPVFLIGSATGGEPERKARVQALIKQLADESFANRQAAYDELRDTFVRKRDIPELTKEIARNDNPDVKMSLQILIASIDGRWRLPHKGWTNDIDECSRCYQKEIEYLGYTALVTEGCESRRFLRLHVLDGPIGPENMTGLIDLILTLEPEGLGILVDSWTDFTFLGTLTNLEELALITQVTDLTPLKGLTRLRRLSLDDTEVADLTPLKGLTDLSYLSLQNTKVTDLTPLKDMSSLWHLNLQNTKVTDLMPLKGLPNLLQLDLHNTGVSDLTPLNGMPKLGWLNLQNTKVTDLTPLEGMSIRIVREK